MMTNATIFENNRPSNDLLKGGNCNRTNTNNGTQNCGLNMLQIRNRDCLNNTDCEIATTTENNQENNTKNNQVVNKDTVLKYVYKQDDKIEIPVKNKGHFKNSLKRRRRSPGKSENNSPLPRKVQKPALIVNYETSHGPRDVERLSPVQNTKNTILGANLADFNIETLHDNYNLKNEENVPTNLKKTSIKVENLNEASNEREDYGQYADKKSSQESVESNEREDYKDENRENKNSGEHEDYLNRKPSLTQDESGEDENYRKRDRSTWNDNSVERKAHKNEKVNNKTNDSTEREYYGNRKSSRESDNSGERKDYGNKKSSRGIDVSGEQSLDYKNAQSSHEEDGSSEPNASRNYKSRHEGDGSGERENYKNIESSHRRDDSGEHVDYKNNRHSSADDSHSAESAENNPRANTTSLSPNDDSIESPIRNGNIKSHPNSAESKESVETNDKNNYLSDKEQHNRSPKNIKYLRNDEPYQTKHLDGSEHKKSEIYPRKNFQSSSESSGEGNEINDKTKAKEKRLNYKTVPTKFISKSSPLPIQDFDLSDSSYETININDNRKNAHQKENLEDIDPNSAVEILPLSTATPEAGIKKHDTLNSLTDDHTLPHPKRENFDNTLIHINDGEVKPVVEINSENHSGSSEEHAQPNLSDELESLESVLGVKQPENLNENSQSDKIVTQKEVQNGDVKQEFERIPLNYNHDENNQKNDSQVTEAPKEDGIKETPSDGTLDVFAPENVRYDENLNIKFDDLAIKLPEIKLPDDILAYTGESSPYSDDIKKESKEEVPIYKPSFYYNHDDRDDTRERKNKNDDDGDDGHHNEPDTGYYGYYGDIEKKQNYKKNAKEESDEDEDLYEKFVRERFGKRGTFEKRSEKLETAPLNPALYKTIKSILKKTADIDEQAKKSGDPNAGYMWTLEYGEKL